MKLEIFGLIEAHFRVRSSATDEKIAEKQHEKINFWSDGLLPQQVYLRQECASFAFAKTVQAANGVLYHKIET